VVEKQSVFWQHYRESKRTFQMKTELTGAVPLFGHISISRASSDEAAQIGKRIQDEQRHLYSSESLGAKRKKILDDLFDVAEECKEPNWDCYGAAQVDQETYCVAYRFVEALPIGHLPTSVGAEPNGNLTLEWHRSAQRTLSVSVSPQGELYFATLLGFRVNNGTEFFLGEIPAQILSLIREVMRQPNEQRNFIGLRMVSSVYPIKAMDSFR
jgi:hypothetical protein